MELIFPSAAHGHLPHKGLYDPVSGIIHKLLEHSPQLLANSVNGIADRPFLLAQQHADFLRRSSGHIILPHSVFKGR